MLKKTYPILFVLSILYLVYGVTSVSATNKLYFIHQDHLGSASIITDESGKTVSEKTYFPYGSTRAENGDQPSDRGYTGQISDLDQTGLYYYGARYYNPLIAKFTQADAANDGLNRYAYVRNNPISIIDPSGGLACPFWWPGCIADAAKKDWNALTQGISQFGEVLSNNPGAVIKHLATQVVPQLLVYGAAYYAGGEHFAETVDVTMCSITGGGSMCALAAQMAGPYMGKVDNAVGAVDNLGPSPKYGDSAFLVGSTEIYLERGRILNKRVDNWIKEAAGTGPSDEIEFLANLNEIIYKDVAYDLPLVNKVRNLAPKYPKTKSRSIAFYALCKRGVCSQKAQFMHAASRKAGLDTDLMLIGNIADSHLVIRHQVGDIFYFYDPTWNFVTEGFSSTMDNWQRGGFNITYSETLNKPR